MYIFNHQMCSKFKDPLFSYVTVTLFLAVEGETQIAFNCLHDNYQTYLLRKTKKYLNIYIWMKDQTPVFSFYKLSKYRYNKIWMNNRKKLSMWNKLLDLYFNSWKSRYIKWHTDVTVHYTILLSLQFSCVIRKRCHPI